MARSKLYNVWSAMLNRCRNPNVPAFGNYGGRGIVVCDRWLVFDNFYADMGEPTQGMTLDRMNNDGPYSPENCRWADRLTQARNKRGMKTVRAFGREQSISDWSRETGVKLATIWARLNKGWLPEEAISKPVRTSARWHGARHGIQWSEAA